MPSRKVHNAISKLLLGDTFNDVHALKDKAHVFLGPAHRIVGHDLVSNIIIASMNKNPEKAFLAAILHDYLDQKVTEKYGFIMPRKKRESRRAKKTPGIDWFKLLE